MSYLKQLIVPAITALVVVLLVLWMQGPQKGPSYGTASTMGNTPIPTTLSGGSSPSVFNALEATESFISDGTSYLLSTLVLGGTTAATSIQIYPTVGTCSASTSTVFSLANPFTATSTVTFGEVNGIVARTTDFYVGTTTVNVGISATTTVNSGFIGINAAATGAFLSVAGRTTGPAGGYNSPSGGQTSQSSIVVGPSEYLTGYATSTAVTGGNGVTSCNYKFLWIKN